MSCPAPRHNRPGSQATTSQSHHDPCGSWITCSSLPVHRAAANRYRTPVSCEAWGSQEWRGVHGSDPVRRADGPGEPCVQGVGIGCGEGPEHAIAYDEALALHTTQAARLLGEDHLRGAVTPGRFADLTIWGQDRAHCPSDTLRDLNPTHTFVGGVLVTPAGVQ